MSFPRYEHYKDSGVEWLGEVPAHWGLPFFQRCVYVAEGQVNPGDDPFRSMILVAPNHVESGTGRLLLKETAEEQSAESGKYLCQPGDVIYSKIRPTLRKACLSPDLCLCSADMYPLRGINGLRNEFLFWFLLSDEFSAWAALESDRVAMPKINRESLKAVRLVLPTEAEQIGIAKFLNAETAKIDALITEQRTLIDLLKEKRQAVISHAVTKGLDPDVAMKDSGVEWLGEVPAHWETKRIKHLVESFEQGWSPQCEGYPVESDTEWGVLKVGCVNGGIFRREENKILPMDVEPIPSLGICAGDLLISRANTRELVGGAAVADQDYSNLLLCDKLYRIKLKPQNCDPKFLGMYLGTASARGRIELSATGASSSMVNIGQSVILEMQLSIPPYKEQLQIASSVREEITRLDALTAEAETTIALLQERRSALISAAVTGKIDVRQAA